MPPIVAIALLFVGALGLYLLMPGARLSIRVVGGAVVLAAIAGLLAFSRMWIPDLGYLIPFATLAFVGLVGGIAMITVKQPVYSALFFVLVVICVTGLLVLSDAQFLAMGLLAIYAGAILVTYVFVIMLAQQGGTAAYDHTARTPLAGVIAGFLLLGALTSAILSGPVPDSAIPELPVEARGTVQNMGIELLTTYVVGIQLSGILLLSAMVGAIAIARRKAASNSDGLILEASD
ncbi:MAG: NADH-quinone oxidoreductase subunit J [Phycisphaerae bacterium]